MDSLYTSRVLVITVGARKTYFRVHQKLLGQTAFFDVEGPPKEVERTESSVQGSGIIVEASTTSPLGASTACSPSSPILAADPEEIFIPVADAAAQLQTAGELSCAKTEDDLLVSEPDPPGLSTLSVDYHLHDRHYGFPAAFHILVNFLYKGEAPLPTQGPTLRTCLQAYMLAQRYQVAELQNRLMDGIRAHHASHSINLVDVQWVSKQTRDDISSPLLNYAIEQLAYEIARDGLTNAVRHNKFMVEFLTRGDRMVRFDLFEAIARHARTTQLPDPATDNTRRWHISQVTHPGPQEASE